MRSEKTVRTYLRIAALFFATCFVTCSTRPAAAGPGDTKDAASAGETDASPSKPAGVIYEGDKLGRIPFADLDLIVAPRKVGKTGWVPQLTGSLNKKKLFTLTFPNDLARRDPQVPADAIVARLDPSTKLPQIIFSMHSNGPHCCTFTKIATVGRSGRWQVIDGEKQDASGYHLADLDGDGSLELVSIDYSFLYEFGSYAQSEVPVRISQLRSGKLKDVTTERAFQSEVRRDLTKLEERAEEEPRLWSSSPFLAAWVATKINLGEGEAAWTKMLANFDREWDWRLGGCKIRRQPRSPPERCTFPEALKRHLIKHGYKMNFDGLKME